MILKNATIIDPINNINDNLDIEISDKKIQKIAKNIENSQDDEICDFSGMIITPGLVDIHCHLREPGGNEKETISSGIDSAINGGYTAICPMANTNPVMDNLTTLKYIFDRAKESQDIGFYPICALSKNLEGKQLVNIFELIKNGAFAFSDDGKPIENMNFLYEALSYVSSLDSLIISHSEDSSLAKDGVINKGYKSSKLGLKGIPNIAESVAIARELEIVRATDGKYHFAHISTKRSVELIRQAKRDGLNITCETAPHYFSLTEEDILDYDARFKVNPPLRSQEDLEAIIEGLQDSTIDVIATDHAPHTLKEKLQPIQFAPMGIAGFETALGLTLTKLVHTKKITLSKAIQLLSSNPASIMKLNQQGQIKEGHFANLTIIDPNKQWTVQPSNFKSKCKFSPFEGQKLKGKAIATVINGKLNVISE